MSHQSEINPLPSPSLVVKHICLANAFRDEKDPQLRLGLRLNGICEYLKKDSLLPESQRPIIYSIKEIRTCLNQEGTKKLTPHQILVQLAGSLGFSSTHAVCTKVHSTVKNPDYVPFYLGQMYDPEKVELLETKVIPYYQEYASLLQDKAKPDSSFFSHVGGTSIRCKYAFRDPKTGVPLLTHTFVVESVHMPLDASEKKLAATLLNQPWSDPVKVSKEDQRILRIGDMNTFKDDPQNVAYESSLCMNGYFQDLSQTMFAWTRPIERIYGTFLPFPQDPMYGKITSLTDPTACSHLDHAYVIPAAVDTDTIMMYVDVDSDPLLFDHKPIIAQVRFIS